MHLIGFYMAKGIRIFFSRCFYIIRFTKSYTYGIGKRERESLVRVRAVHTIRSALSYNVYRGLCATQKNQRIAYGLNRWKNVITLGFFLLFLVSLSLTKLMYERTKWRRLAHSCHSKTIHIDYTIFVNVFTRVCSLPFLYNCYNFFRCYFCCCCSLLCVCVCVRVHFFFSCVVSGFCFAFIANIILFAIGCSRARIKEVFHSILWLCTQSSSPSLLSWFEHSNEQCLSSADLQLLSSLSLSFTLHRVLSLNLSHTLPCALTLSVSFDEHFFLLLIFCLLYSQCDKDHFDVYTIFFVSFAIYAVHCSSFCAT